MDTDQTDTYVEGRMGWRTGWYRQTHRQGPSLAGEERPALVGSLGREQSNENRGRSGQVEERGHNWASSKEGVLQGKEGYYKASDQEEEGRDDMECLDKVNNWSKANGVAEHMHIRGRYQNGDACAQESLSSFRKDRMDGSWLANHLSSW
jgi:hypothetical protein